MARRLTQRDRQRVGRVERPAFAGESAQGGCPDQSADLVGQPLQAANLLPVAGTVGESSLGVGNGELMAASKRVGPEVASRQGDHVRAITITSASVKSGLPPVDRRQAATFGFDCR